ncbi:eukaryotic translation initiation factor 4 gamma-like [Diospyros lotus]|uniref:eukaryotic translation initiation factor 4 gamma-like n=1 Tax=Diospyros lotus TaxID=55363 RepID=UPI00225797BE|nr:eukaryotic translation initiation factor 4 gamma-like [Diospyros lotus]
MGALGNSLRLSLLLRLNDTFGEKPSLTKDEVELLESVAALKTDADDSEPSDDLLRKFGLAPSLNVKEIDKKRIGVRGRKDVKSSLEQIDLGASSDEGDREEQAGQSMPKMIKLKYAPRGKPAATSTATPLAPTSQAQGESAVNDPEVVVAISGCRKARAEGQIASAFGSKRKSVLSCVKQAEELSVLLEEKERLATLAKDLKEDKKKLQDSRSYLTEETRKMRSHQEGLADRVRVAEEAKREAEDELFKEKSMKAQRSAEERAEAVTCELEKFKEELVRKEVEVGARVTREREEATSENSIEFLYTLWTVHPDLDVSFFGADAVEEFARYAAEAAEGEAAGTSTQPNQTEVAEGEAAGTSTQPDQTEATPPTKDAAGLPHETAIPPSS